MARREDLAQMAHQVDQEEMVPPEVPADGPKDRPEIQIRVADRQMVDLLAHRLGIRGAEVEDLRMIHLNSRRPPDVRNRKERRPIKLI